MVNRIPVLAIVLIISVASVCNANLIANGDFETGIPEPPSTGIRQLSPGSANLTSWTIDADIDWVFKDFWQSDRGNLSIGMGSGGSISQIFPTVPGVLYEVDFALAGDPEGPPATKTLQVSAAGFSQDFAFDTSSKTRTDMGWEVKKLLFTATDPTTDLIFTSLDNTIAGPALDNVSVSPVGSSPVPEPATLLLLASGFGFLVCTGRLMRSSPPFDRDTDRRL